MAFVITRRMFIGIFSGICATRWYTSSKPDLAIEVAMEAGRRGVDAVPTLLKKMFSRVLWLARGRAD
ncbi:hypothetical protein, partial [Klebsiella aerogenes]|uniref:hypothetical protein n=1 Tax=Klebsiella aerogenes TaxID=548 RepID=UPI00093ACB35